MVISSDGQTVTTSIAFASITVTYPEEMEFETITATDGTRTYTRVASGTVVFDIANYGEWVVSCMNVSVTVSVTADIDYPIELKSGFDVQEWLQAGSVSGTYASLDEVLADEKALRQLFTKHASVDYLVECCSSDLDESVEIIIANDLCAKWINLRDYALDTLYANQYIASAMDTADKYFYGEWALVNQVPKMTSATSPSGNASASSNYNSSYNAWQAFNEDNTFGWASLPNETSAWIRYNFASPIKVTHFRGLFTEANNTKVGIKFRIQATSVSNPTESDWQNVSDEYSNNPSVNFTELSGKLNITEEISSIRVLQTSGNTGLMTMKLQFLAYQPKGNVPIMTSNSAPYGEAIKSSEYSASYSAYKAFDGDDVSNWCGSASDTWGNAYVGYKFTNPICCKGVYVKNEPRQDLRMSSFAIKGSNDGTTWTTLETINRNTNDGVFYSVPNNDYYLCYAIFPLEGQPPQSCSVQALQFYGRELKVSVPKMDGNTSPWGEAFASSTDSVGGDFSPWKAFNKTNATNNDCWLASDGATYGECGYDFGYPVVVKSFMWANRQGASYQRSPHRFTIKGSNDGTIYDVIGTEFTNSVDTGGAEFIKLLENDTPYRYYKMSITEALGNAFGLGKLDFFGLDYSEHEERRWIYDHGVEVETLTKVQANTGHYEMESDQIYMYGSGTPSNATIVSVYANSIDFNDYNYSLECIKYGNKANVNDNFNVCVNSSEPNSYNNIGTRVATKAINTPFTESILYVGVSSVKQVVYPSINGRGMSDGSKATVTEWWLE